MEIPILTSNFYEHKHKCLFLEIYGNVVLLRFRATAETTPLAYAQL